MLGYYEVKHKGSTYFGNVSLLEFHRFDYEGNNYLFHVEQMAVRHISHETASAIDHVKSASGGLISEDLMLQIRKLKLVSEEDESSQMTLPTSEPGSFNGKCEYPVTSIALLIAQKCNMSCGYCYGEEGKYASEGMMSEETAFKAVDWLFVNSKKENKVNISFFGGEPLLNFALMQKVVYYAKKQADKSGKSITFNITTNATLITDDIIYFLKNEKIHPLISFDGTPEYQNNHRPLKDGRGSYNMVHANIQKLRAVFPNLMARATVYGDSDPGLIKKGIIESGFSTYHISKASPVVLNTHVNTTCSDTLEDSASQRMQRYNQQEIKALIPSIKERKLETEGPHLMLVAIDSKQQLHYACGVGKGIVGVSIDGGIYPCHRFIGQTETCMGDINCHEFSGVNSYYKAIVDNLPDCRFCWVRYYCGGGCFYNNKAHTGDIHRPNASDCEETKLLFEGLMHVYCQLDDEDMGYLRSIFKQSRS